MNLGGFGHSQRVAWKNNEEYRIVSGASFACANISALIGKYFEEGVLSINIYDVLKKNARKTIESFQDEKFLSDWNACDKIKSAAIFPFSKET